MSPTLTYKKKTVHYIRTLVHTHAYMTHRYKHIIIYNIYIYILHTQIQTHTYTLTYIYTHTYIYIHRYKHMCRITDGNEIFLFYLKQEPVESLYHCYHRNVLSFD